MVYYSYDFRNPTKLYDTRDELDISFSLMKGISCRIADRLERFGTKFLNTQIPNGEDKGKTVGDLLIGQKLDTDHMQMICDVGSMMLKYVDGMSVVFALGMVNGQ